MKFTSKWIELENILSFMCFANCIFVILNFWANIHLQVSAYQVTSFVFFFLTGDSYIKLLSVRSCWHLPRVWVW